MSLSVTNTSTGRNSNPFGLGFFAKDAESYRTVPFYNIKTTGQGQGHQKFKKGVSPIWAPCILHSLFATFFFNAVFCIKCTVTH